MLWNNNFPGMPGNLFLLENSCFDPMCLWQCWAIANVIFYNPVPKGFPIIDVLSQNYGSFCISNHQEICLGLNLGFGLPIAPAIHTCSTYCSVAYTLTIHNRSYHLRWISSMFGLTIWSHIISIHLYLSI